MNKLTGGGAAGSSDSELKEAYKAIKFLKADLTKTKGENSRLVKECESLQARALQLKNLDLENLNLENRNADLMIQVHELQTRLSKNTDDKKNIDSNNVTSCEKCPPLLKQNEELIQKQSVLSSQLDWVHQQLLRIVSDKNIVSLKEAVDSLVCEMTLDKFPEDYVTMIDCVDAKAKRISTLVSQAREVIDDKTLLLPVLEDIHAVWKKPWKVHWPLNSLHHSNSNSTTSWKEDLDNQSSCPVFGIKSAEVEAVLSAWTSDVDKRAYTRRWLNTIASNKLRIENTIEFTDLSIEVLDGFKMLLIPLLRSLSEKTTELRVHTRKSHHDNGNKYDLRIWAIPLTKARKSKRSIIEEKLAAL